MWLWIGASPLWWFFGTPFSGSPFVVSGPPTLTLLLAMLTVMAGMTLFIRGTLKN